MIPAWVWSMLIIFAGCIAALWMGSNLPEMNPWEALELVLLGAACAFCATLNNFPLLLALGSWIPFFPHLLGPLPVIGYFLIWIAGVLFFRLCLQGYISYRQSFTWYLVIVFAWVPIRFLMNPVTKLGATAGGSGVSGAAPYFNYVLAACFIIFLGAVLTDRNKIAYFLRWCFVITLAWGLILTVCAFIPATAPYLAAMGSFSAGNIGDGIQRLVALPGYGLYIAQAALCPALFRMKRWQSVLIFVLGMGMIVLGGNRSTLMAVVLVVPTILFLRRKSHAMILSLAVMVAAVGAVRLTVSSMDSSQIPPLMRSMGVLDSRIDVASGGDASAKWRYAVWESGIAKIMESPFIGKGFGNLPLNVESEDAKTSTDFELVLAGGESHNGFITAAYGFGIPFMVALSLAVIYYLGKESVLALAADKFDPEIRDLHAFLAAMLISYPLLIYSAFDMSVISLWTYISISIILTNLPRQATSQISDTGLPLRKYGEEPRPAGPYSYRPR